MSSSVIAIGLVVICTAIMALLARTFKQPVIPAYILAGLLVGPQLLRMVKDPHAIATMSEMTLIFVMFAIGLEMDIDRIKSVGRVVTFGGLIQVLSVGILGFLIALLWFDYMTSIYIGLVISFASTALVVKTMGDQHQLDTLQGGIVLGILLVQDIIAIMVLSLLPAEEISVNNLNALGLKTFGIVSVGLLAGQHVFPRILRRVCDSSEILTLCSLAIGFLFAFLAESQGLSMSIGAFITGVSLANLPYGLELQGRMKSLRDFFIPIFFASLGIQIAIPSTKILLPIAALTVVCLTLKPLMIAVITALFGYQKRTAYYVGVSLVPVSEFGLVIVALGIKLEHTIPEVMTISIAVMALSMLFSAYLSGDKLYQRLSGLLQFLDRIGPDAKVEQDLTQDSHDFDCVLVGLHRAGRYLYPELCRNFKVMVIEHSLERLVTLRKKDIACILGDATQTEVWEKLGDLSNVKLVISTIPNCSHNLMILKYLRHKWPDIKVILSAEHIAEADALMEAGANYVMCVPVMAGRAISEGCFDKIFHPEKIGEAQEDLSKHLKCMMEDWDVAPCNFGH